MKTVICAKTQNMLGSVWRKHAIKIPTLKIDLRIYREKSKKTMRKKGKIN